VTGFNYIESCIDHDCVVSFDNVYYRYDVLLPASQRR
jgi:hypothetical protein